MNQELFKELQAKLCQNGRLHAKSTIKGVIWNVKDYMDMGDYYRYKPSPQKYTPQLSFFVGSGLEYEHIESEKIPDEVLEVFIKELS